MGTELSITAADCSASLGFGVRLSTSEIEDILEKLGVEYDHDEPQEELCKQYGLQYVEVGSWYSGYVDYIVGPSLHRHSDVNGDYLPKIEVDANGFERFKKMLNDSGIEKEPAWVFETLWY
jgi:hypothetical protein